MRFRLILPLAACGDDGPDETGSTDTNNPSTTAPANPPPGGVPAKPIQ